MILLLIFLSAKCGSDVFFLVLLFFQYYLDPPVKLNEALERYGLKKEDFFVLNHGESQDLSTNDGSE